MAGLYIHIPFCRQACIYCNFYFKTGAAQSEVVIASICREIEMRKLELTEPVKTIYFGGGTPSFVAPQLIENILATTRNNYSTGNVTELTLEANPDDITPENLRIWKASGVNRLSIGVQSFFDDDLKWMNRAHKADEAESSIVMALAEGFEVSIDLIFGLPGSSFEKWRRNLEKADLLGVHHLSCYGLTLEENTGWKKLIERKKYSGPDEAASAEQFEWTMQWLEKRGWDHYEISNYCRPGFIAKHNTSYWQGEKYLGFGPSAHSFNGKERQWNISDNLAYVTAIQQNILPGEKEVLSDLNKVNEFILTGLRTKWGVDIEKIKTMYPVGLKFNSKVDEYLAQGLLRKSGATIFLTPKGMVFADAVTADLFF